MRRQPWVFLAVAGALVLLLLIAPVVQILIVRCCLDPSLVAAYVEKGQDRAFYQFVLTAFAALVAMAGYLTYRNRKDAEEDARRDLACLKEEFTAWSAGTRKAMEEDLARLSKADDQARAREGVVERKLEIIDAALKDADAFRSLLKDVDAHAVEAAVEEARALSEKVREKMAEIEGIRLPSPGETERDRRARDAFNDGVRAYRAGDPEKAIRLWREALSMRPDAYEAHFNLGYALAELGRLDEAIDAYSEAIRLKADEHKGYYNIACAYALKGKAAPAAENLRRAIELDAEYRDLARRDRDFDLVRSVPRVARLLGPS